MAERRMFAKSIVLSDAFLDMPLSTRCLYFTLGMLADDDGFVGNPKSIMRQCGASNDDMVMLLQKRFILGFDNGVIVIKHWRINNYLQADRKRKTNYCEELETLMLDENGSYTERTEDGQSLLTETVKRPITEAQQKRYDAKKESSLPCSFEYKIRQAFNRHPCPICGCTMVTSDALRKPTIQHNVPISLGGRHELDNISIICARCNTSIQNRMETPPYNTEEVKEVWERIGNGLGMYTQDSIGKDRLGKDSIEREDSQARPTRHKYGPFSNVLLSDDEMEKLKEKFPNDYEMRINDLSIYIDSKGAKYKSHYSTILNWDRMDQKRKSERQQKPQENESFETDEFLSLALSRS